MNFIIYYFVSETWFCVLYLIDESNKQVNICRKELLVLLGFDKIKNDL